METLSLPYALLSWIRAHKKKLAERNSDGTFSSGLGNGLTQYLFGFERQYRGCSQALRQPELLLIAKSGQRKAWYYRYDPQRLTQDQIQGLKWSFESLCRRLRAEPNHNAALYRELLALPAPTKQLSDCAIRSFYQENGKGCLERLQLQLAPLRENAQLSFTAQGDAFECKLQTHILITQESSHYGDYRTSGRKLLPFQETKLLLANPQGQTLGEWLGSLTKKWRALQGEMEWWFTHDEYLWPTEKATKAIRLDRLKSRLRDAFSSEEMELLREHGLHL